jgi:DNA-binding winged helix-turn-helix (wHTH) protein/tetratricopeptide (TPR) repeat protein
MRSAGSTDEPRIDWGAECIWRRGERINLTPKAFLVPRCLVERPQQLVTKAELLETVWPDTHVTEIVLNIAIGQLRQALGDNPRQARLIETVYRRGFRWIGPVAAVDASTPPWNALEDEPSTFVGRAETLVALQRCYARAASGQRQVVFVTGDPGMGKTSVLDELIRGLRSRRSEAVGGLFVGRGQCVESHGAGDAYRPILEALESVLRDAGTEGRAIFARHAPGWLLQMPDLSRPEEMEELRRTAAMATSERMQRDLERAIDAVAAEHTVVLILEDLHWSDPATVGLLWALAVRRERARLLILGSYRPVDTIVHRHQLVRLKHELASKGQCVELPLEGLDANAVRAYLDRRFPRHAFSDDFAARLQEQVSGNPLFLLNALADFEQRGWLCERDGTWQCTVDLDVLAAAVPDSTRELIAFRIDQQSPAIQELLEAASIAGMTFTTQMVGGATVRDGAEVEAECERLARSALFLESGEDIQWPDLTRGRQYRFRHALYRQILSARVPPARCQLLHRRIAERIECGYGTRVAEMATQLSFHYEHAGDLLRAIHYIDTMMPHVDARFAVHEAEALLGHAVALVKRLPESEARQRRLLQATLEYAMAVAAARGSNSPESLRAFDDVHAVGKTLPTSPEQLASLRMVAGAHVLSGQLREAVKVGEQILALAGDNQTPEILLTANVSIGSALLYLGDVNAALPYFERALAVTTAAAETAIEGAPALANDPTVPLMTAFGLALILSGKADQGWSLVTSGVARAQERDLLIYSDFALSAASMTAIIRRDLASARRFSSTFLDHSKKDGHAFFVTLARVCMGWVTVIETRDPALTEPLRNAIEDFRQVSKLGSARVLSLLTDAYLRTGDLEAASRALDQAFDSRNEERLFDAELFRQRASILQIPAATKRANPGRHTEAEELLERAIDIATNQGSRLFGLRATVDLCRLWSSAGKRKEARQRLSAALSDFSEGFNEFDLRVARDLLDELSTRDQDLQTRKRRAKDTKSRIG